jgi:hypothetical protein
MAVNIFKLETDNGGNEGWVLIQKVASPDAAIAMIQTFPADGSQYCAEVDIGQDSQVIEVTNGIN